MTPEADIVNVRFTKSVIASKAAFTYEEAQIRKDDPSVKCVEIVIIMIAHIEPGTVKTPSRKASASSMRLRKEDGANLK